jgi:hypothetical protein
VTPFEREGRCPQCRRQYVITGVSLHPGAETEGPARFRCSCGAWAAAFVPGSANTERLVVTEKASATKG